MNKVTILHGKLIAEKKLIETNFPFIKCHITISKKCLTCVGVTRPTNISYTYKIVYEYGKSPIVTLISPQILYHDDIHMYRSNNALCLFFPLDGSWTSEKRLYNTIVTWTHEWFVYYELYCISGKWEYPEVKHHQPKYE